MSVSPSSVEPSHEMDRAPLEDNSSLKVSPVLNVARQDSGVPEDLASPMVDVDKSLNELDPDATMNSDCNITVIHVTGSSETAKADTTLNNDRKDYGGEGKDSKDGSDSGVEGCAAEVPRVRIEVPFWRNVDPKFVRLHVAKSMIKCTNEPFILKKWASPFLKK